jgi:hypothetical protein
VLVAWKAAALLSPAAEIARRGVADGYGEDSFSILTHCYRASAP